MEVKVITTRQCSHRTNLEHELRDLGIDYESLIVEEHPEVAEKYGIRHSPNLIVDDQVVFRGQPNEHELRDFFAKRRH